MNKQEFSAAYALAASHADLSEVDDTVLHGCALPDFHSVTTNLQSVAKFLRWHCQYLNGQWDSEALTGMRELFRHKVTIANGKRDSIDATLASLKADLREATIVGNLERIQELFFQIESYGEYANAKAGKIIASAKSTLAANLLKD